MKPERDPEARFRSWRVAAMLSSAGLTLALSVGIGIGLGLLLDRWLKTGWLVIVGLLFGVVAGFQQLIRIVIRASADQEAQDKAEAEERRNRPVE